MEVRSRDQSVPWMKSKRQSARYKHVCHLWELVSACWLIRHLLSPFLCKWGEKETEQQEDRHLYFIGPDTWLAVKLMSQLSRGGRKGRRSKEKHRKEKKKLSEDYDERSVRG